MNSVVSEPLFILSFFSETLSITFKQSTWVFFIPQGVRRDTIQPSAIALDHNWRLLAAMVIPISQRLWSVLLGPVGAPFVKLSVGSDKTLFMHYHVDQEKRDT